jgi:hypothetical protein
LSSPAVGNIFVEPVMKVYLIIQPKIEVRIQEIAEIISDLRDSVVGATQKPTQVRKFFAFVILRMYAKLFRGGGGGRKLKGDNPKLVWAKFSALS